MKIVEFLKKELEGWENFEKYVFPSSLVLIILISIYLHDSKVALASAICGISYSILAGKGKISCYFFGLCGTFCYSYLAFKNMLWGNFALYILYYLPMQIFGIFKWKQHLKKDRQEIVKTKLSKKENIVYFLISIFLSMLMTYILYCLGDKSPFMDGFATVLSVLGLILTVKRCIEQWFVWFVVNGVSMFMWIGAYLDGSNCFATVLMWFIYWFLSIYFYVIWKKELNM
jgi:nicotinamide mononucleotide transporter